MGTLKTRHPETLALHAGWRSDPETGSIIPPIYQTTSYQFENTEHAADLFALRRPGNIYTRLTNPTTDILEKRLAALEGGVASVVVSSGQSASAFSVLNLAAAGDNIVSSTDVYGGTYSLFANTLKNQGIEVRFVDPTRPESFAEATDDRTRAYYGETLANPKLAVFPIQEVANIGNRYGIPLIIDNTTAPLICRPFDHGASIVIYSTTKYLGGHGNSIGGAIIDSGKFNWSAHATRQPLLNTPDPSYHGAIWTEAAAPLGPVAYALRVRAVLLRDLGSAMPPFNAFMFLQGIETLPLRMERHCFNAEKVVEFLAKQPTIQKVIYPTQDEKIKFDRAKKYMNNGFGGLVGFELKGGRKAGEQFINALQLFYHVANIGDARSLAIHPASTTHSQMNTEEQLAAGVTEGYVRLSIGLEYIDDILDDLSQALAQVK